jgi:hypothetical protein
MGKCLFCFGQKASTLFFGFVCRDNCIYLRHLLRHACYRKIQLNSIGSFGKLRKFQSPLFDRKPTCRSLAITKPPKQKTHFFKGLVLQKQFFFFGIELQINSFCVKIVSHIFVTFFCVVVLKNKHVAFDKSWVASPGNIFVQKEAAVGNNFGGTGSFRRTWRFVRCCLEVGFAGAQTEAKQKNKCFHTTR